MNKQIPNPNDQQLWSTQSTPGGFFRAGTVIEVQGMGLKAENGRFVVTGPFPFQAQSGRSYHQWIRLTKSGEPTTSRSSAAIRGGDARKIARMLETGAMTIISEPK